MSETFFVMLTMLILSLFHCEAQHDVGSGYNNDGSRPEGLSSFRGQLLKKIKRETGMRYAGIPRNMKALTDPTEKPEFDIENTLFAIDERQGNVINGSIMNEATSRSSSCAVASVPCSCASATGTCACASTGCTCTVAPCTFNAASATSSSSSSSGSSSSGSSSSSSSSSSSGSSSSSSSSLSISKVCTGTTATPPCVCYTTTCVNGVCGAAVQTVNPSAACTAFLG